MLNQRSFDEATHAIATVVILVDHGFVSGGQSKVAIESTLGSRWPARGRFSFAPADPSIRAWREPASRRSASINTTFSTIPRAPRRSSGAWNAKAAAALAELLARLPRENAIVHAHGWAKALSSSIANPIRASNCRRLYDARIFPRLPERRLYNFQKQAVCTVKAMSAACWATNCDSRNYPFKLWRNAVSRSRAAPDWPVASRISC